MLHYLSRFFRPAEPPRSAEVNMGRCQYIDEDGDMCLCDTGNTVSSSGEKWPTSICTNCPHAMQLHNDFTSSKLNVGSPENPPRALRKKYFPISSLYTPRSSLVAGIIAAARKEHIIQIRGTPASGKTVLSRLVANELFRMNEQVFYIDGWKGDVVEKAGGWSSYLESQTGVEGTDWSQHSAWLLLDEAQQSYSDEGLYSGFFKSIETFERSSPCVILFVSYGSAGHALEESQGKGNIRTPMHFGHPQVVGFDINPYKLSLLLSQDEAKDIVRRFIANNDVEFQEELITEMLDMSGGHSGCLVCLMGAVARCDDICKWRNDNPDSPIPLKVVRELLFDDQRSFFEQIYKTSFCRGLPPPGILQKTECAKLLKHAVANGGISTKGMNSDQKQHPELNYIWKKGWLNNTSDEFYHFPSSVHRWYMTYVLCPESEEATIPYETPLDLAIAAIRHFIPSSLSVSPRSVQKPEHLLEDHYQKEFYRSLYYVVDGKLLTSPEYVAKRGENGGAIDFFLPSPKWGVELVRDGSDIDEHMGRFQTGGQYHSLLVMNKMVDYVVLNFTQKGLRKKRPEYGKLYHVQFSQDFRDVKILDANLETKIDFTLSERPNPLFH